MYEQFYNLKVRCRPCPWPALCDILHTKLVEWLDNQAEESAALWFQDNWTGDRGRWMNGYAGYNSTVTNNGAESTWHHIKDAVKRNGTARINVFLKSLFAHLKFKSEDASYSRLFKFSFPSVPKASADTWRDVQRWRSQLMFAFRVYQGNAATFAEYVAAYDTLHVLTGRQDSLYTVLMRQRESGVRIRERDVSIVMLPTPALIKTFGADKYQDWVPKCNQAYLKYQQLYADASAATAGKSLEEVLEVMESFHTLQRIRDAGWSSTYYKCTCALCHKNCICEHSLIVTLRVDTELCCPPRYQVATVPLRRKLGNRPSQPRCKLDYTVKHCVDTVPPPPLPHFVSSIDACCWNPQVEDKAEDAPIEEPRAKMKNRKHQVGSKVGSLVYTPVSI